MPSPLMMSANNSETICKENFPKEMICLEYPDW